MPTPPAPSGLDGVLIRVARADDGADLARLAALDSAPPLAEPALVAEQNGAIAAALCLSTGRAVADPFLRSLHLVELLRHHAPRREAPSGPARGRRLLPRLALAAGLGLIGARRS
jgi:hypothetical protein